MKTIPTPPQAYTLISSTRHIGYSLKAAIADLIDNSIAAQAGVVDIEFENQDSPYILILDNGIGMSENELNEAMQYGSADPNRTRADNDLGRYGLGLKTASLSQCKILTVITKKQGICSARRWDLNYIENNKNKIWPLIVLETDEIKDLPGYKKLSTMEDGTAIIWQGIDFGGTYDQSTFDDQMYETSEHLALVFHRYLYGDKGLKKLLIRINGNQLLAKDPFLLNCNDGKKGHKCKAEQSLGQGKNKITLCAYILPHDLELSEHQKNLLGTGKGLRRTQGFYIYRNKRLITYGNWYGLKAQGEFFKLARILVDIPNCLDDEWALDVKKSIAIPPKRIIKGLHAYVDSVANFSKNAHRIHAIGKRKKRACDDIQLWDVLEKNDEIISISINRKHKLIRQMLENAKLNESFLTLLERTLPIEAIYFSRSNENRLANENSFSLEEMKSQIKEILTMFPKGKERNDMFDYLLFTEPFIQMSDEMMACKGDILNENF